MDPITGQGSARVRRRRARVRGDRLGARRREAAGRSAGRLPEDTGRRAAAHVGLHDRARGVRAAQAGGAGAVRRVGGEPGGDGSVLRGHHGRHPGQRVPEPRQPAETDRPPRFAKIAIGKARAGRAA
jgi:hypothetical protein